MSWILDRLSPAAQRAFIAAQSEAFYAGTGVTPFYLLIGLLQEPASGAGRLLNVLGISPAGLAEALREQAPAAHAQSLEPDEIPPWLHRVLDLAFEEKRLSAVDQVGPEHLMIALLLDPGLGAFPPGLIPRLNAPLARRAAGYPRRFNLSPPVATPFRGRVERYTDPESASEGLTAAHAEGYRIESAHASGGALWVVLDDCRSYGAAPGTG